MGLTVVEVEAANPPDPEVTQTVEFLIDSGAIYSVVPTPVLEGLDIKPLKRELSPLPMIPGGSFREEVEFLNSQSTY